MASPALRSPAAPGASSCTAVQVAGLAAPLLEGVQPRRERSSFVKRLAGWHGPDPTIALMACLALAACTWVADSQKEHWRASATVLTAAEERPQEVATPFLAWSRPGCEPILLVLSSVILVSLLIAQFLSERLISSMVAEAVATACQRRFGCALILSHFRVWPLLGRLVSNRCILQNPAGFQGDCLVLVRRVSCWGHWLTLLNPWSHSVEIEELRLEDIDIFVEMDASGSSNLQVVLKQLQETAVAAVSPWRTRVQVLVLSNICIVLAGKGRLPLPEIRHNDLMAETGAASLVEGILLVLVELLQTAQSAAGLSQQGQLS